MIEFAAERGLILDQCGFSRHITATDIYRISRSARDCASNGYQVTLINQNCVILFFCDICYMEISSPIFVR